MASVKQKVAAIERKKAEVAAGARKLQGAIREQERVNAAAVANIQTGIRKVSEGIKAQAAENKAYIKDFYFGEGKEGKK